MKRYFFFFLLLLTLTPTQARKQQKVAAMDRIVARQIDGKMAVSFRILLDSVDLGSMQSLAIQPVMTGKEGQRLLLRPFLVTGRKAHIQYQRMGNPNYPEATEVRRNNGTAQTAEYEAMVPYEAWMDGAQIGTVQDLCGCGELLADTYRELGRVNYDAFDDARFCFLTPTVEEPKIREERGSAFLDFRVGRTEIDVTYRKNPAELQKIGRSIDLVRNDRNLRITRINIHGYASPEGGYANNERLARERSAALLDYVKKLYPMDGVKFTVDSTPEDWDGLRRMVKASALPHKDGILRMADAQGDADAKEKGIRNAYPQDYAEILRTIYPALRHSDYLIEYVVKPFTLDEAREVFERNPKQLSQNEMFLLANSYEHGSDAYDKVINTAAYLFPDDATANLNAANVALMKRDVAAARRFLLKAGDSPEAQNARGLLAWLQKDFSEAERLFTLAAEHGLNEAKENLKHLNENK